MRTTLSRAGESLPNVRYVTWQAGSDAPLDSRHVPNDAEEADWASSDPLGSAAIVAIAMAAARARRRVRRGRAECLVIEGMGLRWWTWPRFASKCDIASRDERVCPPKREPTGISLIPGHSEHAVIPSALSFRALARNRSRPGREVGHSPGSRCLFIQVPARGAVLFAERSSASPSSPHSFSPSLWMPAPPLLAAGESIDCPGRGRIRDFCGSAPSALGFQAVVPVEGYSVYRDDCDSSTAPLRRCAAAGLRSE